MPPTTAWDETKKEESNPLAADASSSRPASAEGKKGKKEKDKKKGSGAPAPLPPPAAAPLSRRSSRADSEQSIDLMDRAAAGKVPRKPPPEAPAPPKANEEAYIPLALAKAKLAEYMCDLNLKHERLVEEIDETYSNINKETQLYFLDFAKEVKKKALERSKADREKLLDARRNLAEVESKTDGIIGNLREKQAALLKEKQDLLVQLRDGIKAGAARPGETVVVEKTVESGGVGQTSDEEVAKLRKRLAAVEDDLRRQREAKDEWKEKHDAVEKSYKTMLSESTAGADGGASAGTPEQRADLERLRKELAETETERDGKAEEQKKVKREIYVWTKEFTKREGREPTKDDRGEVKDKFDSYKALGPQVSKLDKRIEQLKKQIAELEENVEGGEPVGLKLARARLDLLARDKEIQELKDAKRAAEKDAADARANAQLTGVTGAAPDATQGSTMLKKRVAELTEENERLRASGGGGGGGGGGGTELDDDSKEALELEIAELREKLASGAGDGAAAAAAPASNEEYEQLQTQMQEVERDLSSARAELQAAESSRDDATKRAASAEAEAKAQADRDAEQVRELQAELETLRASLKGEDPTIAMKKAAAEDKAKIDALQGELKDATAASGEAKQNVERLEGELGAAKKELAAAQKGEDGRKELNRLRLQLKREQDKVRKLEKSGGASVASGGASSGEMRALQKEKQSLTKDLNQANARITKMEVEMGKLKGKAGKDGGDAAAAAGGAAAAGATGGPSSKEHEEAVAKLEKERDEALASKDAEHAKVVEAKDADIAKLQAELDSHKSDAGSRVQDLETRVTETETALKESKEALEKSEAQVAELEAAREKDATAMAELQTAAGEASELKTQVDELSAELAAKQAAYATLEEKFREEAGLRKKMHNIIEDLKGKIRVICRVRPMSKKEIERGCKNIASFPDEYSISMATAKGNKDFTFDTAVRPEAKQSDVFEDTRNLVQSAVDGFNVCIFAYGQTGSGKTFTMAGEGDPTGELAGITPRAMREIYSLLKSMDKTHTYKMRCYMMELYNDVLIDLLCKEKDHKKRPKLDIKKDTKGMVFVANATVVEAADVEGLERIMAEGNSRRHTAGTQMNAQSSRSHLMFSVVIETVEKIGEKRKSVGKLTLVDLAGSERVGKTGATKERLKEAMSINRSLSALGDVIAALSSGESFVPYRNSKLTLLLSDSLGGNAKTLMFVNISPADYNMDESVMSMVYASRVKLITNDASKNVESKEVQRLKATIDKLRAGKALDDDEEDQTLTVDEEAFKNQLQSVHDYDLANKTPGTPREGEEAAAAADDE